MPTATFTVSGKPENPACTDIFSEDSDILSVRRKKKMKSYECEPCGYIYDPEAGDPDNGIAPGTPFENLPEDWVCPVCGLGKVFKIVDE